MSLCYHYLTDPDNTTRSVAFVAHDTRYQCANVVGQFSFPDPDSRRAFIAAHPCRSPLEHAGFCFCAVQ